MGGQEPKQQESAFSKNWNDFKIFLYNGETGEVCGRTAKSWVEITLFFIVLYAFLACFWGGMLYVAVQTMPELDNGPKHLDYLFHRGPGLHVVPRWDTYGSDKQKYYYQDKVASYQGKVENFLDSYNTSVDDLDDAKWGNCKKSSLQSNWNILKPCFFFYFNKIADWVPEPEEEGAPITIRCKAAKSEYKKYLNEPVVYPAGGMSVEQFPWRRGVNWTENAPLVAVQLNLNTAEMTKEVEVRVVCQAVAGNIYVDKEKPNIGMVDFRIKAKAEK